MIGRNCNSSHCLSVSLAERAGKQGKNCSCLSAVSRLKQVEQSYLVCMCRHTHNIGPMQREKLPLSDPGHSGGSTSRQPCPLYCSALVGESDYSSCYSMNSRCSHKQSGKKTGMWKLMSMIPDSEESP